MKQSALLLILITAGLSSCKKEVTQVKQVDQAYGITFDIAPDNWLPGINGTYYVTFDVPELNNAIFDHGAVMVYLSFVDNVYEALPEEYDYVYRAEHSPGSVTVTMYSFDQTAVVPPDKHVYAKIVLIDARQLSMHPHTDLHDYNQVKSTFRVK